MNQTCLKSIEWEKLQVSGITTDENTASTSSPRFTIMLHPRQYRTVVPKNIYLDN